MKPLIIAFCAAGVALLAGCASSPTSSSGPYSVVAYKPKNPDNVRVKVSLSKQNVYVMEGDKVLMAAATCVGQPGHVTPTGSFHITGKIPEKRSGEYGFRVQGGNIVPAQVSASIPGTYVGYPMAWWCEFSPGYGFHQGFVWPMPRTHGCLRMHKSVAPKFYALVKVGTPVSIAQTQPEDATTNVPRPQDYRDPDPPASFLTSSAVFAKPAGELLVEQP
jgi:L,D-transpeptidase catalytic domain